MSLMISKSASQGLGLSNGDPVASVVVMSGVADSIGAMAECSGVEGTEASIRWLTPVGVDGLEITRSHGSPSVRPERKKG